MRRPLAAALFVAAASLAASAQDPAPETPTRTCADGKLVDRYWSLSVELSGIAETAAAVAPAVFAGDAGAVRVEISVLEPAQPTSAAEARDAAAKAWTTRRREMKSPAAGDAPSPWTTFVEKDLTGTERLHGFSYLARGVQVFVVHADADAKSTTAEADVRRALGALRLGDDRGASLLAVVVGDVRSRAPDEPAAVLDAAQGYLASRETSGLANPRMAEHVLEHALRQSPPSDMSPDQVHAMHERLGRAKLALRKGDSGAACFRTAIELAAKTSKPDRMAAGSRYNLACACSIAGKTDEAFAALEAAFATTAPVGVEHLKTDTDLDNLHKDPRWGPFLAARAAAAPRK